MDDKPTKRVCQSGLKNKSQSNLLYNKPTLNVKTYRLKVKRWGKIYHAKNNQKMWEYGMRGSLLP